VNQNLTNPNILIVRLSAIGDCIETLPMVAAIKAYWPNSKITWIVDCGIDSILRTQPMIDSVIRIKKGFLKRPSELLSLRKELKMADFDVAIDPQGLLKRAMLVWLSGAKRRIGFASPQSREQSWWLYHDRVLSCSDHLVDRHLELLKPLSIPIPANHLASFNWTEPPEVSVESDEVIRKLGLKPKGFLCVNPSAGWPSKVWPRERYAEVVQRAALLYQVPSVVIWGSPAEKADAEWIVTNSKTSLVHLAPPTKLMLLSGLLRRAKLYVGSDTGPMHLSAAVGTRCIGLFGPTDPRIVGAYGAHNISIQNQDATQDKNRRSNADNYAMRAIQVEDVLRSISSAMQE